MKVGVLVQLSVFCISAVLFSACVYAPYDGQSVTTHNPVSFVGYALKAEETIKITAYNKSTGQWDILATTTSASSPTTIGGDELYSWSKPLDLSTVSNYRCYWDTSCSWPGEGTYNAEFRVQEGNAHYLPSFEKDGVACVVGEINAGETWMTAGYNCMSPNSPIINLKMHIVL